MILPEECVPAAIAKARELVEGGRGKIVYACDRGLVLEVDGVRLSVWRGGAAFEVLESGDAS